MKRFIWVILVAAATLSVSYVYANKNGETAQHVSNRFEGEGGYWSASYESRATESWTEDKTGRLEYNLTGEDGTFKLEYKGEVSELADVRDFVYSYSGARGNAVNTMHFDGPMDQRAFIDHTGRYEDRNFPIRVEVKWGKHMEAFVLTAK
jgi:hypothetical protein